MEEFKYNEMLDFQKLPQEYKGIKFYPLLISQNLILEKVMKTIGIPKTYIKTEPVIMKMSYLKFLCLVLKKKDEIIDMLSDVTKEEDINFEISLRKNADKNNLKYEDINIVIHINNACFDEMDFDIIREIILKQNYYSTSFIEEYDPELEEMLELKQKASGESNSFEDKIFVLCALMNRFPEEFSQLSYYQFYKLYYMTTTKVSTEIYQGWISSGFIKLEKGKNFKTYLDPTPNRGGRYDEIKMSKENFLGNIGMGPESTGNFLNK